MERFFTCLLSVLTLSKMMFKLFLRLQVVRQNSWLKIAVVSRYEMHENSFWGWVTGRNECKDKRIFTVFLELTMMAHFTSVAWFVKSFFLFCTATLRHVWITKLDLYELLNKIYSSSTFWKKLACFFLGVFKKYFFIKYFINKCCTLKIYFWL